MAKPKQLKKDLKNAIEHGERFLELYKSIPEGAFGVVMINQVLKDAYYIEDNYARSSEEQIREVVARLMAIE